MSSQTDYYIYTYKIYKKALEASWDTTTIYVHLLNQSYFIHSLVSKIIKDYAQPN
jgi:hypothetical protein